MKTAAATATPTFAARLLDYGTVPAFLAFTVAATIALADTHVAYELTSGLVVGVVAAAAAIVERLRPEREEHRRLDQPLRIEAAHFVFSYTLGYGLAFAACAPIGRAMALLLPLSPWPSAWPVLLQIVLAALLAEGVSYWQHRLSHRLPLLWRFHALHHSGGRMNLARTARFHFADIGPGAFLVFLPLVLLRAPESIINWAATLSGVFGILQHSNIRIRTPGWLDRLVCTPAVHRLHHSLDGRESNANFGTLVMVFDRLFGSYRLPDAPTPARMGIEDDRVPRDFLGQMFGPFRRARGPQAASPPR